MCPNFSGSLQNSSDSYRKSGNKIAGTDSWQKLYFGLNAQPAISILKGFYDTILGHKDWPSSIEKREPNFQCKTGV